MGSGWGIIVVLLGAGIGIGIIFYFTVRRDIQKRDRRAWFEAYKWGAANPDFTEETREQCRAAIRTITETY